MRLSRIFKWYGDDFGGRQDVVAFIAKYRYDPDEKAFLARNLKQFHVAFNDYDWSLNIV